MIRKLLYKLTASLPCRIIDIDGKPYLERYGMPEALRKALKQWFGITIYLHRFVSGDSERHVHDHPWNRSIALVLAGTYIEERVTGFDPETGWQSIQRNIRWFNKINGLDFHRIVKPKPQTWTLFIHTKRIKGWGFLHSMDNTVTYHQPFDVANNNNWEPTALSGWLTRRQPMQGQ